LRALLDTHALLWWLSNDRHLSAAAGAVIRDSSNEIFVSAASVWEIATKVRLGRLHVAAPVAHDIPAWLAREGFLGLAVEVVHGHRAGWLPGHHQDPFDRMLIAQAQAEGIAIISNEEIFDRYGVRRIW
jgi:PIN domain nuclease of toxin-antitoxin system